jgi:hypothetical protein
MRALRARRVAEVEDRDAVGPLAAA